MPCGACGSDVPTDSVYCPKCGKRLHFDEPRTPAQATADNLPLENGHGAQERTAQQRFQDTATGKRATGGGEEELWQGGYSGKDMVGSWILAGIASIALIVASVLFSNYILVFLPLLGLIWLCIACLLAYRKLSVRYRLTNQRFIHKVGILRQVTDRIEVIDIDDVTFEQGLVQRLVGVGTIRVTSSDSTHPELLLRGINDVKRIADLIDDVRRQERRSRGLHIEAI